ncbi:MAG: glycosyl hydrolase family protein [Bacteroidetes bacterium]|nr:MAG: glycosyl hydrolase family protein [Bacteroidota bacterium]
MRTWMIVFGLLCAVASTYAQERVHFSPAQAWTDNNGTPINAHGGGVLFHKGKYYWYGEHKIAGKSEEQFADGGIHCYSSADLMNWKDEGVVLSVDYKDTTNDLAYGCILERPKVVYNKKNRQFVAYFKLYLRGVGYETSNVGVAVASKPNGPFIYHHKFYGGGSPKGSGDFSIFKDDDGSLYHLTVRKPDKAFVIGKLDSDYYYPVGDYQVAKGIQSHTEAPAVIKRKGLYHLLGSGSTGWKPNIARYYTAKNILGQWTNHGNPCLGYNAVDSLGVEKTFGGQSSYIIPVQGIKDAFIAMFDIWKPESPIKGRYIWLPIDFSSGKMSIVWSDIWNLKAFSEKKLEKVSFVDPQSPKNIMPFIASGITPLATGKLSLDFSDEFNDNNIDTTKWTVENSIKKRVDITLFANKDQVEEKDGNMFVYYRKSNVHDTAYNAGRFNSKGKYAPTYGFLECRMHVVKPNGHQMAFWMMPEGDGMRPPLGVDGTANDGAEIDIMEGNKTEAYSNGLHWDGYTKPAHKSNGALMKTPGIHNEEYHVYGFEWTPNLLKFYFDGKVVREITDQKLIPQVAHFIYFSGSCFGENNWVDGDIRKNEFIQRGGVDKSYIDYVRVFKHEND